MAMGWALSCASGTASAETIIGIGDINYNPDPYGDYYFDLDAYAGAAYQYSVGIDNNSGYATDGFGDPGDYWSVRGDEHFIFNNPAQAEQTYFGVGANSWCQSGACAGQAGLGTGSNFASQHVLFAVTTEADIRITLSNAPAVEPEIIPMSLTETALGSDLLPAFTLYSGVSLQGWNSATPAFTNMQDFTPEPLLETDPISGELTIVVPAEAPDLIYLDHNANTDNANSISGTYHLPVGFYSLWFGGNFANSANTNDVLACLTTNFDGNCTGFGGSSKNFELTIQTAKLANVPVPAAGWLFAWALAGLGFLRRAK